MNRISNIGITNNSLIGKLISRRFSTTKKILNSSAKGASVGSKPKVPNITTLENGIRVATIDWEFNGGAIGLAINTGPRYETPEEYGASLFCDKLFLKSGRKYSLEQIIVETDRSAAQVFTTSTREQLLFSIECLPRDIPNMLDIMADSILSPRFDEIEFEEQRETIQWQLRTTSNSAEQWANEAITAVAFGADSPLGRVNMESNNIDTMSIDTVKKFQSKWYVPSRMVFCGLGIGHDDLVGHIQNLFGHLPADNLPVNKNASLTVPYYPPPPGEPSVYRGGYLFVDDHRKNEIGISLPGNFESFASVAIAFPAPCFYDKKKYYSTFILGYLLGSGSSFSSGGPGKGMFSRVYTRILRYGFMDSATFIYNPYYETGLFGINVNGLPDYLKNIQETAIVEMINLQKIDDEEFLRAKNQLRSLIFMNIENTGAAIDDFLRQICMYNTRADFDYHLSIIDSISKDEVTSLATEMLSSPPSILIRSESDDPGIPYSAIAKFIKGNLAK